MIDKKIEAAKEEIYEDKFLGCCEMVEAFKYEDAKEMFYKEDIKEAIGLGANWGINELLKELWHPASEEPEGYDEWILLHYNVCNYYSLSQVLDFKSWKEFVDRAPIKEWLYIDDLFQKEGGEHD